MTSMRDASLNDIPDIMVLAEETWWPTYSGIVSDEQVRFMLDLIYSKNSLEKVIKEGAQTFILIADDAGPQGFASYGIRPEDDKVVKLHKLYVHPRNHGKGLGRKLLEEVKSRAKTLGADFLDLNVNRYNPAKDFYARIGFSVVKEEDVPIGPYWMNDYVMRMRV